MAGFGEEGFAVFPGPPAAEGEGHDDVVVVPTAGGEAGVAAAEEFALELEEFVAEEFGLGGGGGDEELFLFEEKEEAGDEVSLGDVAALAGVGDGVAGGDGDGHEVEGVTLGLNLFDEGFTEAGGIDDQGAVVFDGGVLGEAGDAGEDVLKGLVEGKAFKEAEVE